MLTVELKIDGALIGHVYCVNQEGSDDGWCGYRYEYYRPGGGIITGCVKHFRSNGAVALLKEVCEDIETKGGK